MKYKLPVVLFFIEGIVPNEEEQAQAAELKAQVRFRNVTLINPNETCEAFDDLAGLIPDNYAAAKVAKIEAKAKADADAEAAAALAAELAEKAAKKAGKGTGGAAGQAPTNSPAPGAAPGAGSGPPADWKPA